MTNKQMQEVFSMMDKAEAEGTLTAAMIEYDSIDGIENATEENMLRKAELREQILLGS